ncbi:MAG: methyl-accepting chemotaxis protein [Clostridiales bacterium]|nr:methyl-accepting chemotaxis protein [Clostridiales bacterium]
MRRKKKTKEKVQKKISMPGKKKTDTDRRREKRGLSLKVQLTAGFLIPVCMVALVGNFSYNKAAKGMLDNYGESARTALQMTAELLDFGFESVDADSIQLFNDQNIKNYVSDTYKNDQNAKNDAFTQAQSLITTKQNSNKFIKDIIIVTEDDLKDLATATGRGDKNGFYDKFMEEGRAIADNADKTKIWAGEHKLLDERFGTSIDNYICSQYRLVSSKNACVIIDVSMQRIKEILNDLTLGEGSIIAFVTADGREVYTGNNDGFSFSDKEYYRNAKADESGSYSCYVEHEGKEYFFMYEQCRTNHAAVCAMTPKNSLMKEALSIKNGIYLWVILSCIVVLIVGVGILFGISRNMGSITRRLVKVSQGDLTVDMRIRDKAEFGKLSGHIMETISNTKRLIMEVRDTSLQVNGCVGNVRQAGTELKASTEYIQEVMKEIEGGVGSQALDAEQCLQKMDSLSDKILNTVKNVKEMEGLADNTRQMISEGTKGMDTLIEQSTEAGKITERLSEKIRVLNEKIDSIRILTDTIDEISEETTLLSLNASIEAARVGEAGKGFSVVAEAIKKLADSSKTSSKKIRNVIEAIEGVSEETIKASGQAGAIVGSQSLAVEETRRRFSDMSRNMEKLLDNISASARDVEGMNTNRRDTLNAIESISAVSEETAASAVSVEETVNKQTKQVEQLSEATKELENKMDELLEAIQMFIV